MDGAGEEFLAGARLAAYEDSRIGRRDRLDLFEYALERRAGADQLFKVVGGANLVFEVELLAGEFILERFDLAKREDVFDGEGDLISDLAEQLHLVVRE